MKTPNIVSIRFNNDEAKLLKQLLRKYKLSRKSSFIKAILFTEIKPFLSPYELELLGVTIIEINAIGRNLNQLLKYKAYEDIEPLIDNIKYLTGKIEKLL